MKLSNIKDYWHLLEAARDGKIIQLYQSGKWYDISVDSAIFVYSVNCYRIKPTPKPPTYRPWKPEEVPVGALIKRPTNNPNNWDIELITGRSSELGDARIYTCHYNGSHPLQAKQIKDNWLYSTDQGKTWLPCGILVEDTSAGD